MFRFLKTLLTLCFMLAACVLGLLTLSYLNEKSYQNSCETLGMECETGASQKVVSRLREFYDKFAEKFKDAAANNSAGK